MLKKKKFLIGGLVILVAIGYLGFMGFKASATYYYTVSQFLNLNNDTSFNNIRINGDVVTGSVAKPDTLTTNFDITEGGKTMPVSYQGVVPDAFKEGYEVVVEGHLDANGVFLAHTILVKCPSKYVAANTTDTNGVQ